MVAHDRKRQKVKPYWETPDTTMAMAVKVRRGCCAHCVPFWILPSIQRGLRVMLFLLRLELLARLPPAAEEIRSTCLVLRGSRRPDSFCAVLSLKMVCLNHDRAETRENPASYPVDLTQAMVTYGRCAATAPPPSALRSTIYSTSALKREKKRQGLFVLGGGSVAHLEEFTVLHTLRIDRSCWVTSVGLESTTARHCSKCE